MLTSRSVAHRIYSVQSQPTVPCANAEDISWRPYDRGRTIPDRASDVASLHNVDFRVFVFLFWLPLIFFFLGNVDVYPWYD